MHVAQELEPAPDVNVPAAHAAQLVAVKPAATAVPKAPAAHVLQAVAPVSVVVCAAGHGVHDDAPAAALKEPMAHVAQLAAPAAEKEPARHVRHALADVLLVFALAVPAAQGVGASAP